jgi:hypothetical protein
MDVHLSIWVFRISYHTFISNKLIFSTFWIERIMFIQWMIRELLLCFIAVYEGDLEAVIQLLERNAKVNIESGKNPLLVACQRGFSFSHSHSHSHFHSHSHSHFHSHSHSHSHSYSHSHSHSHSLILSFSLSLFFNFSRNKGNVFMCVFVYSDNENLFYESNSDSKKSYKR